MIDTETVLNLAHIAKIDISFNEAEKFAGDLNDMFAFIDMIKEKEFLTEKFEGFTAPDDMLRDDNCVEPCCCCNEFFENREKDGNLLIVKEKG